MKLWHADPPRASRNPLTREEQEHAAAWFELRVVIYTIALGLLGLWGSLGA